MGADFWQYMYATHESAIAEYYEIKPSPDMPEGWKSLTKSNALNNLDKVLHFSK